MSRTGARCKSKIVKRFGGMQKCSEFHFSVRNDGLRDDFADTMRILFPFCVKASDYRANFFTSPSCRIDLKASKKPLSKTQTR